VSEPAAGERRGDGPGRPGTPGSWARLYALVILALAADIALLLWLTERYR